MHYFITFAKLLMLIIWAILLSNLFLSFPGEISTVLYLLLGFVFFMHFIQLLVIYGAFAEKLKLTKSECLQIFVFGTGNAIL